MLRNLILRFISSTAFTFVIAMANYPVYADEGAQSASPAGAEVYIISPAEGETVSNPVTVKFGLKGMGVAPAGTDIANTGHHHLLIDTAHTPDLQKPLPSDAQHVHFGKGQTEAQIELTPGKHTLQLILGDKNHIPHNPPLISKKITITVK